MLLPVLLVLALPAGASAGPDVFSNVLHPMLTAEGSATKVSWLRNAFKSGVDGFELVRALVDSPAFSKIYDNVEIQHRILEAHPLLASLPGFQEAHGRKLTDKAEMTAAFRRGVASLISLGATTETKVKDPSAAVEVLSDLAANGDAETKALLVQAKAGDAHAIEAVKRLVSARLFPGVDLDVIRELDENATFDTILKSPELMHFIDQDKDISSIFRTGNVLPINRKKRQPAAEGSDQPAAGEDAAAVPAQQVTAEP